MKGLSLGFFSTQEEGLRTADEIMEQHELLHEYTKVVRPHANPLLEEFFFKWNKESDMINESRKETALVGNANTSAKVAGTMDLLQLKDGGNAPSAPIKKEPASKGSLLKDCKNLRQVSGFLAHTHTHFHLYRMFAPREERFFV